MSRHYVTSGELIIPQSPKRDAGGYREPDKLPVSVTQAQRFRAMAFGKQVLHARHVIFPDHNNYPLTRE